MNYLTIEEMTENLLILFDEYDTSSGNEFIQFPTEEDIYNKIAMTEDSSDNQSVVDEEQKTFKANEPIAVIWDSEEGGRSWWIGFFVCQEDDESIKVDHLVRQKKGNQRWIRGKDEDVQTVNLVQVVPVDVVGDWDLRNDRCPVFIVRNERAIEMIYKEYLSG